MARAGMRMIFHQISTGGCQSYLLGCPRTCIAVLIERRIDQDGDACARAAEQIGLAAAGRDLVEDHPHASPCHSTNLYPTVIPAEAGIQLPFWERRTPP